MSINWHRKIDFKYGGSNLQGCLKCTLNLYICSKKKSNIVQLVSKREHCGNTKTFELHFRHPKSCSSKDFLVKIFRPQSLVSSCYQSPRSQIDRFTLFSMFYFTSWWWTRCDLILRFCIVINEMGFMVHLPMTRYTVLSCSFVKFSGFSGYQEHWDGLGRINPFH